jgi:hypothetical protein
MLRRNVPTTLGEILMILHIPEEKDLEVSKFDLELQ